MININTDLFPSTVVYEGMIMNKPIMNIRMMDEKYDFEFVKDNAVLSISDTDNLKGPIEQLLTDNDFQIQLITNGQKHLERYFSNPTTASEKLANTLTSYSN